MDTKFNEATDNLRKSLNEIVLKFNPNHEPAGSSVGGQFASGGVDLSDKGATESFIMDN